MADKVHVVQVHRQEHRPQARQGGDLHAQAALRRQRLRHALPRQSLWKNGTNIFYDPEGYALISETARYYIGGLLKHAPALMAFCAPTTNSYKRLVPGYEAPVNLVYSARNRSAAVRIPVYTSNPKTKRMEFRPPDDTANPYLAFAAMLMAGLDGIENKIDPGPPLDKNTYELAPEEERGVPTVPGSLEEALEALEEDHEFLLAGACSPGRPGHLDGVQARERG